VNLKQLQFAISVAETCSFSQSAENCFATQPTLSNAIAQLEQELNGKLFIRTTRSVTLTPFGEYILPYLRSVLESKSELEKAAYAYHNPEHSVLRIGLSPLIDMHLVNHILVPFRKRHPNINIFFKECLLDDLAERLARQQIDLAIVPDNIEIPRTESQVFYDEPLLYFPQQVDGFNHELRSYQVSELAEVSFILTGGGCGLNGSLEQLFAQEGVQLQRYPGQALSYPVIEEWAAHGIGAGILPKAKISATNSLASPIFLKNGQAAKFSYHWLWYPEITAQQDLAGFVAFIQQDMPALLEKPIHLVVA
jgi:DNA-binding transcriptional LysR family regulator